MMFSKNVFWGATRPLRPPGILLSLNGPRFCSLRWLSGPRPACSQENFKPPPMHGEYPYITLLYSHLRLLALPRTHLRWFISIMCRDMYKKNGTAHTVVRDVSLRTFSLLIIVRSRFMENYWNTLEQIQLRRNMSGPARWEERFIYYTAYRVIVDKFRGNDSINFSWRIILIWSVWSTSNNHCWQIKGLHFFSLFMTL